MLIYDVSFKDVQDYIDAYGDKYIKKVGYLQKVLFDYYRDDAFNVLNFEAGFGKSRFTDLSIKAYFKNNFFRKNADTFLVVKKFKEEVERSVSEINSGIYIKDFAVGITSETWQHWQGKLDELAKKKVIYITHQRYIQWCENVEVREVICNDRDNLIMDEKVLFPIYTYNDKLYSSVRGMIKPSLRDDFDEVCKKLNNFLMRMDIEKHKNKIERYEQSIHPKTLENLKSAIEANWNYVSKKNQPIVKDFMDGLDVWYGTKCLYNAGAISGYNRNHKYWMLKNNVILDASAKIDGYTYANPEKFNLIRQGKMIDHSQSTFKQVDFNSSASKVDAHAEYLPELAKRIVEAKREGEQVLIVCRKKYAEPLKKLLSKLVPVDDIWTDKEDKDNDPEYDGQSIAISWYGNLIGKNWAGKFTQCWLISTPNIPMEQYLLHWMMFTEEELGNKSLEIQRAKGEDQGKFINDEFRAMQKGYIACEMYQAIKRIQRVAVPKGEFFIVNDNEGIVSMIIDSMDKATLDPVMIELDFIQEIQEEKEKKKQENKKSDQVDKFIEYILKQAKGFYKKSHISKELNVKNISRILMDARVKNLQKMKRINTESKYGYIEVI